MLKTTGKTDLLIYTSATVVTKDDSAANNFKALYIGGTNGNLKITTSAGEAVTFSITTTGQILPVATSVVWSTGTACTPIIGLN